MNYMKLLKALIKAITLVGTMFLIGVMLIDILGVLLFGVSAIVIGITLLIYIEEEEP